MWRRYFLNGIDARWNSYLRGQLDLVPFPRDLRLQLTNYCNMACAMCPGGGHEPENKVSMSLEILDRLMTLIGSNICSVGMSYFGEPTLHPDFHLILERIKKQTSWEIGVQTNGLTLSEHLISILVEAKVSSVSVSLDGLSSCNYNVTRPNVPYDVICSNVVRLLDAVRSSGTDTHVILKCFECHPEDIPFYKAFESVLEWKDRGVDLISCTEVFNYGGSIDTGRWPGSSGRFYFPCAFPWFTLVIGPSGEIRPCCIDIHGAMTMANVRDIQEMEAVWNGPTFRRFRELLVREELRYLICLTCDKCRFDSPFHVMGPLQAIPPSERN